MRKSQWIVLIVTLLFAPVLVADITYTECMRRCSHNSICLKCCKDQWANAGGLKCTAKCNESFQACNDAATANCEKKNPPNTHARESCLKASRTTCQQNKRGCGYKCEEIRSPSYCH